MKPLNIILLTLALVTAHASWARPTDDLGWELDDALRQIDRQAKDFDTVLADVQDRTQGPRRQRARGEAEGRLYANEDGEIRISVKSPETREVLVLHSEVQIFNPETMIAERWSRSKHKYRLEPYLTPLGFSETGDDLEDDFLVTVLGEERIDGRRVLGLQLTPKKEKVREHIGTIQLWIDESSWMPARQVVEHVATGEIITVDYEGMARNLKLNPDLFRAKWPRGTKKQRM